MKSFMTFNKAKRNILGNISAFALITLFISNYNVVLADNLELNDVYNEDTDDILEETDSDSDINIDETLETTEDVYALDETETDIDETSELTEDVDTLDETETDTDETSELTEDVNALDETEITTEIEEEPYSDIIGHWAEDDINEWLEEGFITGYSDGSMRPDNGITRAEFVSLMQNVFKLRATAPADFSDVKPTAWYYDAVAAAYSSGIASGMVDGTFKPDDYVTRGQASVFGYNAMGTTEGGSIEHYADAEHIPDWCIDSIGHLSDKGFLSGMTDGRFAYSNLLTRAEAVSFLNRIKKSTENQEIVSTESVTEYTYAIEEKNTVITGQELNGDLIITVLIGDNNVTLDGVTVNGNLIIQGGGSDSVLLKDTTITGSIVVDRENTGVVFSGDTSCEKIQVNKACSLTASNDYTGEIGTIYFPYEINPTANRTKINMKAGQIIANAKVYVELGAFVDRITFNKSASESKLQLTKTGVANTVACYSRIDLLGSGEIRNLQANTNGITNASSLAVKNTNLGEGVEYVEMILSSASK